MAKPNQTHRPLAPANESHSIETLVATVRALWATAEQADERERLELKQDIVRTINGLKAKVESGIGKSAPPSPNLLPLFRESEQQESVRPEDPGTSPLPRFAQPVLRVYAKDFADHALQHLPQAAKYHSVEGFRKYLVRNLRFNSQSTRRRAANHILSRFFPGEVFNEDLAQFAACTADKPALGEALFYLTCRTEQIVSLVAEEVVFPSVPEGGVTRNRLREYVQSKIPYSKSADEIANAITHTYQVYGVGTANRTRLNTSVREGCIVSFAYVLHLEFPHAEMHAFEKMLDGPMHKWLLWDRQWMIRQLYRLREARILSKVSEIDRMRQFTTKFALAEAMPHIVALARESLQ